MSVTRNSICMLKLLTVVLSMVYCNMRINVLFRSQITEILWLLRLQKQEIHLYRMVFIMAKYEYDI